MRASVSVDQLGIDRVLYDFVNQEAMPGTGVVERPFWGGFAALVRTMAPRNAALMLRRDQLQEKIDAWHLRHPGAAFDRARYKEHLLEIGYLMPEKQPFAVDTADVDAGDSANRGAAIGGAGEQCTVCTECRQCTLGQPVRRTLRHRRHRGRRGPCPPATIRSAAPRSSPTPAISWTSTFALPKVRIATPWPTASPRRDSRSG